MFWDNFVALEIIAGKSLLVRMPVFNYQNHPPFRFL